MERLPWVFADYHFYIENLRHPERLDRMATYGLFNLRRFPSSFAYYLFPVWVLPSPTSGLLFEQLQTRLYDFTELPPATFLLTDVVLLGLAGYALRSTFPWSRKGSSKRILTLAVAVGLCAPCGLMLTAVSLRYRYRIEFYPLLEFSAFLGVCLLLGGSASPRPTRPARLKLHRRSWCHDQHRHIGLRLALIQALPVRHRHLFNALRFLDLLHRPLA